jgi:hypothetical protein
MVNHLEKLNQKLNDFATNAKLKTLPNELDFFELIEKTISIYQMPSVSGIVDAPFPFVPVIVIPDIHARADFLLSVFNYQLPLDIFSGTVIEALEQKKISVVCVGDGFHGEGRVKKRWKNAYKKYLEGNPTSSSLNSEMAESLAVMCMVMEAKCSFPENFHFLKGNHENILNEEGNGNHPFRKFAMEGEMVYRFMLSEFGQEILDAYAKFEHLLPLVFRSNNLLISHAEPVRPFTVEEIKDGRCNHEIIIGLTWTGNNEAEENSVSTMLSTWLPDSPEAVYLGGHRPVTGKYLLRCNGKFIQIHNPDTWPIAIVRPDRKFDPEIDILYTDQEHTVINLLTQ